MIAGAWILGFFLVQEAKPPQEPEAKAKEREQPRDTDRSREPTDASEMTRAAARLIEASNYRFRVTGERPVSGEMQKVVIDGRFQEGKPLMLKNERAELVTYRTDDRVAFQTEKKDDWDVVRLDAALFGGDGNRRIRRQTPGGATAAPRPEARPEERRPEGQGETRPKEERPKEERPKEERPKEDRAPRPEGEQREPREQDEVRGSDRLFDDRDPAANRADRQALIWIALVPAPHDLVRALLDGITETTRKVEKGGFFDKDKIVYESRLTPQGEELCRDHFARLLGGGAERGEINCFVRVIGDHEGAVDRIQLDVRRPGAEQPLAMRLDYEIDKVGRTELEIPDAARRALKE